MQIGEVVHFFEEVDSTNEVAKELARKGNEGVVVVAETQAKGKGGFGRSWFSPRGGLWMSIILNPGIPPREMPVLNLVCSLAIAEAISGLGLEARTRWPNDVTVGGKKVAGILAEANFSEAANRVVVGIGIDTNVDIDSFPSDIRERATSLKQELKRKVDHNRLLTEVFKKLNREYRRLKEGHLDELLREWKALSDMMGKPVEIKTEDELLIGIPVDIQKDGSLLVRTKKGDTQQVIVGQCRLIES